MSDQTTVEVIVVDDRWNDLSIHRLARRACTAALVIAGVDGPREVAVLATNDADIARLNGDFRGQNRPTNVLSWPSTPIAPPAPGVVPPPPQAVELGDIALAWETCAQEAGARGIPVNDHVTHLVLHGCLHLVGYDHETADDAEIMERLEIAALEKLGLKNPYL